MMFMQDAKSWNQMKLKLDFATFLFSVFLLLNRETDAIFQKEKNTFDLSV